MNYFKVFRSIKSIEVCGLKYYSDPQNIYVLLNVLNNPEDNNYFESEIEDPDKNTKERVLVDIKPSDYLEGCDRAEDFYPRDDAYSQFGAYLIKSTASADPDHQWLLIDDYLPVMEEGEVASVWQRLLDKAHRIEAAFTKKANA